MNIKIPDSWLREYLKTNAKPHDIQRCLSLCGPSIERTEAINGDVVYDVEVTTNRVDSFSIYGMAREAAAILPEFGYKAELKPFKLPTISQKQQKLDINILDTKQYCRRIVAIKISHIRLGPSPQWLRTRLEKVGQRPLNNIIDITNYVMWETGHPCHAFDYDLLKNKTIIVREAKRGEHMVTLDNKRYALRGKELVFDDGKGNIIDLPGIMGTANTVITDQTKNVLLFVENSDPVHIRYGSMGLGIRTQAATINEKGPDPETAYTAIVRATSLATEITNGTIESKLFDMYPGKMQPATISVSHTKLTSHIGVAIEAKRISTILNKLGFSVKKSSKKEEHTYMVTPPSWRSTDITIPEDIVEEVARIYGYHNIPSRLPEGELPLIQADPEFRWEEEIKIRLRDWGYTELLTYSMISESQMDEFHLDKTSSYKIENPLSEEWVHMRPSLRPGFLSAMKENLSHANDLRVFELSKIYRFRKGDLPDEEDVLIVGLTENRFFEAKGLGEAILGLFGTPCALDAYGSVTREGEITLLELSVTKLVRDAKPIKKYTPIPKYPPVVEDLAFIVPDRFEIGPLILALKQAHPLVASITLLDVHEDTRTLHITYQNPEKNLTNEDVIPIREKLIRLAKDESGAILKSS